MTYSLVLAALAHATRRLIYERVRGRPHTVGELVQAAGVSQPAVSQHLRVLERANLVQQRSEGTKRYYRATPAGLVDLSRYIETLSADVMAEAASPLAGKIG